MFNILIFTTDDKKILNVIKFVHKNFLKIKICGLVLNSKIKIKNIRIINSAKKRNENKIISFIKKN